MKKFKYIKIGIASPEEIVSWANPDLQGKEFTYDPKRKDKVTYIDDNGNFVEYTLKGEVKKRETLNYRTQKPEREGLFCEAIFGPTKDNQCSCGKTVRTIVGEHRICEKCGVEFTSSIVRRERMGYIALASPVVHPWYLRNTPSKIAILLDMTTERVEEIVYLASYVVIEVNDDIDELYPGQILTEQENAVFKRRYFGRYKTMIGAEAIKYLLKKLDLNKLKFELLEEIKISYKWKKEKIKKRLEIVEAFLQSTNKPEWMVMDVIPVIPPDLRPMVQLEGGRFATTDLNELYRRIINRNTRLRKLFELGAPDLITKNEKRLLQETVDALIDSSKHNKNVAIENNRILKSLSNILRGKQGCFHQRLLNKRVDYSGSSVICVGPSLKMYQCGIPRDMALILFKPFIISYLNHKYINESKDYDTNTFFISTVVREKQSINRAKELFDKGAPEAFEALEKIIVEHPILLKSSRALDRFSIQAFEPVLVDGKVIRLHPLLAKTFNIVFEGEQMSIHVPLSKEAQAEARMLMLASKNILSPKDGKPVVIPSKDMVIGNYYLTIERSQPDRTYNTFEKLYKAYEYRVFEFDNQIIVNDEEVYRDIEALSEAVKAGLAPSVGHFLVVGREGKAYKDISEVEHAYERHEIDLHTRFVMPGRAIDKPFVHLDPNDPKYEEKVKYNYELKNMYIVTTYGKLIFNQVLPEHFVFFNETNPDYALGNLRNAIPEKYFLKRGTNFKVAIDNISLGEPADKNTLLVIIYEVLRQCGLAETAFTLDKIKDLGFKYSTISGVTTSVFDAECFEKYQNFSEVDNFVNEHKQVSRSNMTVKINEELTKTLVKPYSSKGLSLNDFFIQMYDSRRCSIGIAFKPVNSNYLTRRLVEVSQDIIITQEDCVSEKGVIMTPLYKRDTNDPIFDPKHDLLVPIKNRIVGRFASKNIYGKVENNEVILVHKGQLIDDNIADTIQKAGITEVEVRSILTCNSSNGVCIKCYGSNLATNESVNKGEAVGVVAAQSIGESASQLIKKTFNSNGIALYNDNINQGLSRLLELFEARAPKGQGIISEIKGIVESVELVKDSRYEIKIHSDIPNNDKVYLTDAGKKAIVKVGEYVEAGDLISEGAVNIKELLRVSSVDKVQKYILKEIQKSYRTAAAVEISDKHVEIIVKQMLQKVVVIDSGETDLLPGTLISKPELYRVFKDCCEEGLRIPAVKPVVLGITRASLKSDSFLAAASFQETTRVLTEAAIKGKIDNLEGLKENVIIGGLIPVGTGIDKR